MEGLIRKYKISKIIDLKLTNYEYSIIYILEELPELIMSKDTDIFGNIYTEYNDKKSNRLFRLYNQHLIIFANICVIKLQKLRISDKNITILLKEYLEFKYNLNIESTSFRY